MNYRYCMILFLLFYCVACASKGTTVVLMDDGNGKVGKVEVSTEKGAQVLDAQGASTSVETPDKAPSKPKIMPAAEIEKNFHSVLAAQPTQPHHYLLYFESGKTTLLPESMALLDDIAREAKNSTLCDLSVVGHSDTKGSKEANITLSLDRARSVRDKLIQRGIPADCMSLTSHGEGNLLVPTADEVDEPRNRRVEVVIR